MKWTDEDGIERELQVNVAASTRTDRCMVPRVLVCDPPDIIAALRANPMERSAVFRELLPVILAEHDAAESRALAAEKALADASEALANVCGCAQALLAPKHTNRPWTGPEVCAEIGRLRDDFRAIQADRDSALSRLAEVERERDVAWQSHKSADIERIALREVVEAVRAEMCVEMPAGVVAALARLDAKAGARPPCTHQVLGFDGKGKAYCSTCGWREGAPHDKAPGGADEAVRASPAPTGRLDSSVGAAATTGASTGAVATAVLDEAILANAVADARAELDRIERSTRPRSADPFEHKCACLTRAEVERICREVVARACDCGGAYVQELARLASELRKGAK